MSLLIKSLVFGGLIVAPGLAFGFEPCDRGVPAIDIVQGAFAKAPGYISPDTEALNKDGSLKEQGWHNLRKAVRPLRLVCRYGKGNEKIVVLPDSTDTCIFVPGKVLCQ